MPTTETPLGTFEYDQDLYDINMARTQVSLADEVLERTDGMELSKPRSAVKKFRKTHLAAIIAEWATATRRDDEAHAKESSKRKCGCGQYIITHDNGTLARHTRYNIRATRPEINSGLEPKRIKCQWSGKFPPAVVNMRYDANNRIDRRIQLAQESLKLAKAENNKELISEIQIRLQELNTEKYSRTQIMLSHHREGSRKGRKAYTRHVSGGQVTSRKRFSVVSV